jgi:muconolactone delta-isomerase
MKFLVIVEAVPGGPLMPPEQSLALAKAQWDWSRKTQETGMVEVVYGLADHAGGLMGGFAIVNYESAEQLAEALATMPAAGLATVKMYPLVAPEVTEKIIEGALAQLPK